MSTSADSGTAAVARGLPHVGLVATSPASIGPALSQAAADGPVTEERGATPDTAGRLQLEPSLEPGSVAAVAALEQASTAFADRVGDDSDVSPYIISYVAHAFGQPELQRSSGFLWCCLCVCPCSSRTPLGRELRCHLLNTLLQMVALVVISWQCRSQLRLLLFLVYLALQCALIYSVIRHSERHKDVDDLRLYELDVKAKLVSLAGSAILGPVWWSFDVLVTVHIQVPSDVAPPMDSTRLTIAVVMFFFHCAIFARLVCFANEGVNRFAQKSLRPLKLRARRYDAPLGSMHGNTCSICLGDFEERDSVFLLPCKHLYHADCIMMWLRKADACPMRCHAAVFELPAGRTRASSLGRWYVAGQEGSALDEVASSAGVAVAGGDLEAGEGIGPSAQTIGAPA
mmetsp:Transcript_67989/g.197022  ORF Transcript_67989/g.197022 Transcript_67989/m.197022 type:complete len:400 (+) Transcript_67989:27-1226(+)